MLLNLAGQINATIGRGMAAVGDYDGDRRGDLAVVEDGLVRTVTLRCITPRSSRIRVVLSWPRPTQCR